MANPRPKEAAVTTVAELHGGAMVPADQADAQQESKQPLPTELVYTPDKDGLVLVARAGIAGMPSYRYGTWQGRTLHLVTSIDLSTEEGKLALFAAWQGADDKAEDVLGEVIPVRQVIWYDNVEKAPSTGLIQMVSRWSMIRPDGSSVSGTSDVVGDQLRSLVALFKAPPWEPAKHLVITPQRRPGGRTMHRLSVAGRLVGAKDGESEK